MDNAVEKKNKTHTWFDWTQLLTSLFLPVIIIVYTVLQYNNDLAIARDNRQQDLRLAQEQRDQDMILLDDQQQEAALVDYFTSLTKLLEKNGMMLDKMPEARPIARMKTLIALSQLRSQRKMLLVRTLLVHKLLTITKDGNAVIYLNSGDLSGIDFRGDRVGDVSLLCVDLSETILVGSLFSNSYLIGTQFLSANLMSSDFSWTTAYLSACENKNSVSVNFFLAKLDNCQFTYANHKFTIFEEASLVHAQLDHFACYGCSFRQSKMIATTMNHAWFSLWDEPKGPLNPTFMTTYPDFTRAEMMHSTGRNTSFIYCKFDRAQLMNTSFIESTIVNSSFSRANLTRSSWRASKVINGNFTGADMRFVHFIDGQCHRCIFHRADLTGTNFFNTSLIDSDFTQTNVTDAQLAMARNLTGVIY